MEKVSLIGHQKFVAFRTLTISKMNPPLAKIKNLLVAHGSKKSFDSIIKDN